MTETPFKNALRDDLKARGYLVLRFEDRFTSGIPDFYIAGHQRALWLEAKVDDRPLEPWRWKSVKQQQVLLCHQLGQRGPTPVAFICYAPKQRVVLLASAESVLISVREKVSLHPRLLHEGSGITQVLQLLEGKA